VSLAATFLEQTANGTARAEPATGLAELEASLVRLLADARQIWPSVDVPAETFVRHLAERIPAQADASAALASMHAADLYLACGCTLGNPAALAAFERDFMSQVVAYLSRQDTMPGFTDEVKQILRMRLLVADGALSPRIGGYNGRGPLGAWLRIATVRAAIDLRRQNNPADPGRDNDFMIRSAAPDPELNYLRTKYAGEFRDAFEHTLQGLSAREGNVLRLYFLDAMTAPAIGALYKVSGRTVQRWIAETRQRILDQTYKHLRERLKLSQTEFGVLLSLVESQVDVSIVRHLKRPDPTPGDSS
jgi:RNA polymerase sigma-70 factor (ECF subfamily)